MGGQISSAMEKGQDKMFARQKEAQQRMMERQMELQRTMVGKQVAPQCVLPSPQRSCNRATLPDGHEHCSSTRRVPFLQRVLRPCRASSDRRVRADASGAGMAAGTVGVDLVVVVRQSHQETEPSVAWPSAASWHSLDVSV